jgi:hypothetical protein
MTLPDPHRLQLAGARSAPPISDAERIARREAIDFATANIGLEGFRLSARAKEIGERYVAGDLTLDQFLAEVNDSAVSRD